MITDLTKEHPDKILWRFLLPLMISVIFQQFYNIADSMIAGKFAGESALGAVGASYPITIIYMAFAQRLPHQWFYFHPESVLHGQQSAPCPCRCSICTPRWN